MSCSLAFIIMIQPKSAFFHPASGKKTLPDRRCPPPLDKSGCPGYPMGERRDRMGIVDYVLIGAVVLVLSLAVRAIRKARKNGKACVGCPDCGSCAGNCKTK